MSEDEQSGSNYDTRGNLRRLRVLLCAMVALKPQERWPTDNRDFAVAVDCMIAKDNPFAKELQVLTNVAGRHCPDFAEMLAFGRTAGLIVRRFDWMCVNSSMRMLHEMAQEFSEEELEHAGALALEFWNVSHGVTEPPES